MKYLLAILAVLMMAGMAQAVDVTVAWDSYTDQASIDGFYIYSSATTPVDPIAANRVATVTLKTATSQTITGVTVGQHYYCMTAYKGTIESVKSNEASGLIRPKSPTGIIVTILP